MGHAAAAVEWQREKKLGQPPEIPGYSLEKLLDALSTLYSLAYKGADAMADPTHAGYVRVAHPKGSVFVPFNLTTFFPFSATLDELVDNAETVSLSSDAVFISGSSTFLGAPLPVGDLDFCTYLDRTCPKVIPRVKELAGKSDPFCVKLRWAEAVVRRPWQEIEQVIGPAEEALMAGGFGKGQTWKLNFITRSRGLPAFPLTILGIPVDTADIEAWAQGWSWSFQEALFVPAGAPARSLALPDQLGQYILWLREQAEHYLSVAPLKGAKRALSLTSLLMMEQESDALISTLCDEQVRPLVERAALREAEELLAGCTDGAGAALWKEASKSLRERGGPPSLEDYRLVHEQCATVTVQALARIDQVLDSARAALRTRLT
jgi:hypothetical protein